MVIDFKDLPKIRKQHMNKKIVLASGVFDLLHNGHLEYLRGLKQFGDVIVVLVKSDERVRRGKGPLRPIIPEEDRVRMVSAIKGVDYAFIGPHYEFTKDFLPAKDQMYARVIKA
jgi:cytidyltransferase-like protein